MSRPLSMKKEAIQTRNRKLSAKKKKRGTEAMMPYYSGAAAHADLSQHHTSSDLLQQHQAGQSGIDITHQHSDHSELNLLQLSNPSGPNCPNQSGSSLSFSPNISGQNFPQFTVQPGPNPQQRPNQNVLKFHEAADQIQSRENNREQVIPFCPPSTASFSSMSFGPYRVYVGQQEPSERSYETSYRVGNFTDSNQYAVGAETELDITSGTETQFSSSKELGQYVESNLPDISHIDTDGTAVEHEIGGLAFSTSNLQSSLGGSVHKTNLPNEKRNSTNSDMLATNTDLNPNQNWQNNFSNTDPVTALSVNVNLQSQQLTYYSLNNEGETDR